MNLVSEEKLRARQSRFDAMENRSRSPLEDDPIAGQLLKFYLLLTEAPQLLADEGLLPDQFFWSRHYWFCRYVKVRQAVGGPDAGLEQQAHQILEHPHPACAPDWKLLEEVESLASQHAAAQLSR
jgi:hypothetical protein